MKNPIYGLIAFFIVEALVGAGFVNQADTQKAQSDMENIIFFIVLSVTGLLGFRQYISAHKHQVTTEATKKLVECTDENKVLKEEQATTPSVSTDSGTPPTK
jgi:hypothetical protein